MTDYDAKLTITEAPTFRVGDLLPPNTDTREIVSLTDIRTIAYRWVPLRRALRHWLRGGGWSRWAAISELTFTHRDGRIARVRT